MIDVTELRIFVCTTPTNMSASFDSLMGRAREIFDHDPTSGHIFLFFNHRRDPGELLQPYVTWMTRTRCPPIPHIAIGCC